MPPPSSSGGVVAVANGDRQTAAAVKIQCFWRRICAVRAVVNKRLWKWITNRNTLRIQCAWRRRTARVFLMQMREAALFKRELLQRNVDHRRMNGMAELLHWRGARCGEAAVVLQKWWRATKSKSPTDAGAGATRFARSVREAQQKKQILAASVDAERLEQSTSIKEGAKLRVPVHA